MNLSPFLDMMKIRYIIIALILAVGAYYAYTTFDKDVATTIAKSQSAIYTNSWVIKEAELAIQEKLQANAKLQRIVTAGQEYVDALNDSKVVTTTETNNPSSDGTTTQPQAPSESVNTTLGYGQCIDNKEDWTLSKSVTRMYENYTKKEWCEDVFAGASICFVSEKETCLLFPTMKSYEERLVE